MFTSSNGLRPDSPVRIAGVDVGKVKQIDAQEGTDNTVVTMAIDEQGLPLHKDATAKIRPRIFLEGNFFVDLQPGSPGSAGPRRRLDDRGHPDRDAGPARPGADLAAVRHAAGPARRAGGPGHRPALEADRGRRPRRRPVGARGDRGEVVERRVRVRRPGRARPGRGQPGAPRHGAGPRPRAADRRRRAHLGGTRPQRVRARGPDRQLQPHDGRVRLRGGEPARLDQRAGADARDRQRRVRVAQRRLPAHARVGDRDPARRARDARRRSTPPSPGSSR